MSEAEVKISSERINQAKLALDKLAKKPGTELNILSSKVENILKRYRVTDFFSTTITEETQIETRHLGRGRPSKNSPLQQVTSLHLKLHIQQVNGAIQESLQVFTMAIPSEKQIALLPNKYLRLFVT